MQEAHDNSNRALTEFRETVLIEFSKTIIFKTLFIKLFDRLGLKVKEKYRVY